MKMLLVTENKVAMLEGIKYDNEKGTVFIKGKKLFENDCEEEMKTLFFLYDLSFEIESEKAEEKI